MKKKLLCITPVKHIGNLFEKMMESFDVIYLPDPSESEVIENSDVEIIFTNPNKSKVFLGEKVLKHFSRLIAITTASTGTVHIDQQYCGGRGIEVISIKKETATLETITSTAELAFALTLNAIRNVVPAIESAAQGEWNYEKFVGRQLNQLRVGVIGFGRLGKMYANYARAFGARVFICDPFKPTEIREAGFEEEEKFEIFRSCDVVSIHIHAEGNEKFIGESVLSIANPELVLVNTSRGEVVDELAVIKSVRRSPGFKYFTDVLSHEYSGIEKNVLYQFSKTTTQIQITPHIGGMTIDAQIVAYGKALSMLQAFVSS